MEKAERDPAKLNNWIENVKNLHKGGSTTTVNYSKNMPDIETLMQEWDPEAGTGYITHNAYHVIHIVNRTLVSCVNDTL